jgi:hypothetical protein
MATWIASPTGTAGGDGSLSSPWDLQTALNKTAVIDPGDTLYLRGGTYTGAFTASLLGEADNNITVRPYPGERVIWDANQEGEANMADAPLYQILGGYVTYIGFEFLNSSTVRQLTLGGSNPATRRAPGPYLKAPGLKLINCLVHDLSEGPSFWAEANGAELYGNVVWNNGWNSTVDGNHGHALYCQGGTAERVVRDNILVSSFGYKLHAYGSELASLANLTFDQNILFGGSLIGGGCPISACGFTNNHVFGGVTFGLNDLATDNSGLSVTGNKFHQVIMSGATYGTPCTIKYFADGQITATANSFFTTANSNVALLGLYGPAGGSIVSYTINGNAYWRTNSGYIFFATPATIGSPATTIPVWSQWQAAGYDADGSYTNEVTPASQDYTTLRVNAYDSGRAHLIVTNFGSANSKSVDLSSFATVGDYIRIRNVQDYFGDVAYVKYMGDAVTLDMQATSHTLAVPTGYEAALATHIKSFPKFGVFVLEKYTPIQKARSAVPFIRRRRR